MPIVLCKACGERHDSMLVRCPSTHPLSRASMDEIRPPLKDDRLKKAQEALKSMTPKPPRAIPTPPPPGSAGTFTELNVPGRSPTRGDIELAVRDLQVEHQRVTGDCSNPECPYRHEVLKARRLNGERVKRFRLRRGAGNKPRED